MMERYEDLRERDALHCALSINSGVLFMVSDNADLDEIEDMARELLG